tara:strand:- start:22018 stop:22392 length:375 start_codon:yes stop_codon:yes gene_type:complete
MRILLIATLALNLLVEAPVGLMLTFAQDPTAEIMVAFWSRNYGVAVLAISTLIFWVWRWRDDLGVMTVALGFLMTFHALLATALIASGIQQGGAILHTVLAVGFIVLFLRRRSWCTGEESPVAT